MINESIIRFSSLLIGCVYPAFASYKILNSKLHSDREQQIWLSYWIVYGIYTLFEFFAVGLVWWVPFFNEFKLFFLCWLLPSVGAGSELIYDDFLGPFFARNEKAFDQALNSLSQKSSEVLNELVQLIYSLLVVIAEQCCVMRQRNGEMQLTASAEAALNEVLTGGAVVEERLKSKKELQKKLESKLEPKVIEPEPEPEAQQQPGNSDDDAGVKQEQDPGKPYNNNSEIELRILMAEAVAAQRLQITNQLAYKEHLARLNSFMHKKISIDVGDQRPQLTPKPRRGIRRQAVNKELRRIMHEQNDSISLTE